MKYYIRTTLERKLHPSIAAELGTDYTLLVDTKHQPVESFLEQLEQISDDNAVLLEDDVILCKNFKQEIEKVIQQSPNIIINFFTMPNRFFTTFMQIGGFVYNQCTYYPKGLGKQLAAVICSIRQPYNQYDTLMDSAMRKLNIPHILYRPALVQHIDNNTLIQRSCPHSRRTIYFKDYLDALNIPYEEAYKTENQKRLQQLLNEQFKDYDKAE